VSQNVYLGGVLARGTLGRLTDPASPDQVVEYRCAGRTELFLCASGPHFHAFSFGPCTVLFRGYAVLGRTGRLLTPAAAAEITCQHYRTQGDLPDGLFEGSFTLVLLDGEVGRALLYRNLVGTGFTYYAEHAGRFLFSSNLAALVDALGIPPEPNEDALPSLFLYRYVPGRETLFRGIFRLMPGEAVTFDARGMIRTQRQTLADLERPQKFGADALPALEDVMRRIITDYAALHPAAANLLSGGVDSSYIQAVWNRVNDGAGPRPVSFSATVDHPRCWPDTAYALTAAAMLGTDHRLVQANEPYVSYLLDLISGTAETPNHVQAAYFGPLARRMAASGFPTALCGEGGDGVYGMNSGNLLHNAGLVRLALPFALLRRVGAAAAGAAGWERLHYYCLLADSLFETEWLGHPVNRQAAFTDWPSVERCFGADAVKRAAAQRRDLLRQYRVGPGPMEQLHAANFFTSSMDSASLWATLFHRAGGDLLCPFLDSRLLGVAVNTECRYRFPFRRPKDLLKRALARAVSPELAHRKKLGFGQPVFEWLAPGGQLRPLVERIDPYPFVDRATLEAALARPNWFLYTLLCYDVWHKLFVSRALPRDGWEVIDRAAPVLSEVSVH